MTRLLITLLSVWSCIGLLHAGNTLTLGDGSAVPGGEMTIPVSLTNDAGIVAGEIDIDLPDALSYVAGSCMASGTRLSSHSLSAAQNGRKLVILVYNSSLTEIPSGNGEILSFKLKAGKEPGGYSLTPRVKLSDANGSSVMVTTSNFQASVVAPKLGMPVAEIDFGRVPIRSSYTRQIELRNTGNATLHVNRFNSTSDVMTITPASVDIPAGESKYVTLTYAPVDRAAAVSEKITVVSDAINGNATVSVKAEPYSVNELHLHGVSAVSGDEVEVKMTMNNMEPITAVDFSVTLPEGFTYVAGSAAPATRAAGHTVNASVTDGKLRVLMFHPGNAVVNENDGDLLSFKLKADARGGYHYLNPENVKLANVSGENMTSATSGAYVVLAAPHISCASTFDMGQQPIGEYAESTFPVSNNGDAPLVIDRVVFLSYGFSIAQELPLTIPAYSSSELTVRHVAAEQGSYSGIMNIYSNDADNPMTAVNVNGRIYEPNTLTVTGSADSDKSGFTVSVGMENTSEIVAVQMDIEWIPGMTTTQQDLVLSTRASGHTASVAQIGEGIYRVVIFSLSNTPISGNDGELFTLRYSGTDYEETTIKVTNIRLSNKAGVNCKSPDVSFVSYDVPRNEPTSVGNINSDDFTVSVSDCRISVSGISSDTPVCLYSLEGRRIDCMTSCNGTAVLSAPYSGIYILTVGNRAVKMSVR